MKEKKTETQKQKHKTQQHETHVHEYTSENIQLKTNFNFCAMLASRLCLLAVPLLLPLCYECLLPLVFCGSSGSLVFFLRFYLRYYAFERRKSTKHNVTSRNEKQGEAKGANWRGEATKAGTKGDPKSAKILFGSRRVYITVMFADV